jgi:hypothetical protein
VEESKYTTTVDQLATSAASSPVMTPMAPSVSQADPQPFTPIAQRETTSSEATPEQPTFKVNPDLADDPEYYAYHSLIDEEQKAKPVAMDRALMAAAETEPDRHAKVLRLASEMRLPADVVERNLEMVEKAYRRQSVDYDDVSRSAPRTADWLTDPDNASLARDDVPALVKLEQSVSDYSMLSSMYQALKSGTLQMGASLARIPALGVDVIASKYIPSSKQQAPDWLVNNPIAKHLEEAAQGLQPPELSQSAWKELSNGNLSRVGRLVAVQFAANAPNQAAILLAGLFGGAPAGLALAGATTASAKNAESRDSAVTPATRTANAVVHGAIEGFFENLGTFGILKRWEGAITNAFGKATAREVFKDFAKTLFYSVASEGNEEFWTSAAQDLSDYVTGVNPQALSGVLQRAADAGLVGAFSGGALTAPTGVASALARGHEGRQAALTRDFYTALGEGAENQKLRERLPEKQREFVEAVTKDSGVDSIFVAADKFDTYFQGKNESPASFAQTLGVSDSYNEAKAVGGDVKIPLSTWVEKVVGTDHYQGLANDIRLREEDLSVNEAKELEARVAETEKAAKDSESERLDESASAVGDTIASQLKELGEDPKQAVIIERAFRTLGERMGKDPQELFNQYRLLVRKEGPVAEGGQTLNQDISSGFARRGETDQTQFPLPQNVTIATATHVPYAGGKKAVDAAAWGEGVTPVGTFTNSATGLAITVDKDTINKAASHATRTLGLKDNRARARQHLEALPYLQSLVERALFLTEKPEMKGREHHQNWLYFFAPLEISGKQFFAKLEVKKEEQGLRLHNYAIVPAGERFGASEPSGLVTPAAPGAPAGSVDSSAARTMSLQDFAERLKPLRDRYTFFQSSLSPLGFFSQVEAEVEKMDFKAMPAKDLLARIKNIQGIKQEELKWLELNEFLAGKEEVTKKELLELIQANQLPIEEVVYGEPMKDGPEHKAYGEAKQKLLDALTATGMPGMRAEEIGWAIGLDGYNPGKLWAEEGLPPELLPLAQQLHKASAARAGYEEAAERREKTRYEDRSLPGGKNPRELLYLLPPTQKQRREVPEDHRIVLRGGESFPESQRWQVLDPEGRIAGFGATEAEAITDFYEVNQPQNYRSPHWEEKNVLAHMRVDDREVPIESLRVSHPQLYERLKAQGKTHAKALMGQEFQSDWLQEGRKHGFKGEPKDPAVVELIAEARKFLPDLVPMHTSAQHLRDAGAPDDIANRWLELVKSGDLHDGVPDAPFRKTWHEFLFKRFLRYAAEKEYDLVLWTTGEQQAERYDLSKKVEAIKWDETRGTLAIVPKGDDAWQVVKDGGVTKDNLADYIGKDAAEKLAALPPVDKNGLKLRKLEGLDLKVGGEGMRGFYDKILVDFANKFGKKYSAKVGAASVSAPILGNQPEDLQEWKKAIAELKAQEEAVYQLHPDDFGPWSEGDVPRKQHPTLPIIIHRFDGQENPFFVTWGSREEKITEGESLPGVLSGLRAKTLVFLSRKIQEEETNLAKAEKDAAGGEKVHSLDITPTLRDAALQGFSLFQPGDEQGPRGQIQLMDDQALITLAKTKDVSTFFHEIGHYFLEVLARAAASPEAPQQIKDDWASVLEWLGVGKDEFSRQMEMFVGPDAKPGITRDMHEKWARGFEAYIMEGKAPSEALRSAFARFRVWLISVYRSLRNLNVELTPEIRGVMDRLMATDEEIAAAQAKQEMTPLFSDPAAMGLTGAKLARYQKAIEAARAAAEEELTAKVMRDLKREQEAWYKKESKGVAAEVEKELNAQPVYIALAALQKGTQPDGSPLPHLPGGIEHVKLSADTLKKLFKPELLKKLPRRVSAKDGLHPDLVADFFGFASGTELVTQLAAAEDRKTLIARLTDQRMKERYPSLLNELALREEAMAAVHNEERAKLLRLELEHLMSEDLPVFKDAIRRVARRVPTQKQVREQAVKVVGRRAVRDLSPFQFQRAERQAAREAGEALAKGDLEKAFQAKERELFNHELYRAAIEAQERVAKAEAFFERVTAPDEDIAKTRDMDLVNAARAILARFGLAKAQKAPEAYLEQMKRYDPDAYESVIALVESAAPEREGPYEKLWFDDFVAMHDAVRALWDLARSNREIEIDGIKLDREEVVGILDNRLYAVTDNTKARMGYDKAATGWDRVKMYLLGARAALRRVESWADAVDGDEREKPFRKYLVQPILEATARYREAKVPVLKRYLDLIKPIESTLTREEITAPELGYKFSGRAELLGALLHTGNASNLSKLLRGRGWGEQDFDGNLDTSRWDLFLARMHQEGVLTKADWDFVQGVWDLLEETKPDAQKAHKAMYGFYFDEVTAAEVTTPFGVYRGGYMPAVADPLLATDAARFSEKELFEQGGNSFMFPTTGRGFTKKRVENYAAPLALDLRFVPTHIDKVLRFVHIEPKVKEVARIVRNRKLEKALAALDPTVVNDMLVPWLQRAASQRVSASSQGWAGKAADTFFREVRRRTGLQVMVANVTNTLQQATGVSMAATKVRPKYLRNAMWTYLSARKQTIDDIQEKSQFMRTRVTSQAMEIQSSIDDLLLNPTKYEKARKFAEHHGYFLQAGAQNVVDIVTWMGAYDQAVEEGESEKDAVRAADAAVRQTQGSFNAEDISRFETGTPFMRAFTMFYSYFNMQANLLGTEFVKVARDTGLKKGAGRALYVYALGFMVPALAAELILKAMSGGIDEDDDDQYLDDILAMFFSSQLRTATAMVPVAGPALQAGINAFNDKWYDDRISTSPAVAMIESAVSSPHSVYEAISGEGSKKKAARDLLTALGLMTGIPFAPLSRPIGYALDVSEGKTTPRNALDFTRGLVTGKGPRN